MKKILVILLSIMLAFSALALTACGKDSGDADNSTDFSEEESSSKSKRDRSVDETNSKSTAPTTGSSKQSGTSTGAGSGTSGNNGQVASGDAITISVPSAPSNASMNVNRYLMSLNSINETEVSDFPTYSAYLDEIDRLLSQCDTNAYNKLTADEKAINEVAQAKQNSDQAKASIQGLKDDAVAKDFEKTYAALLALSALKNANVEQVYSLNNMITTSESKLSSRVTDFSTKKAKVGEWMTYIKQHTEETAYIAQDYNDDGVLSAKELAKEGKKTVKSNFFNITGSIADGGSSTSIIYNDKNNTDCKIYQHFKISTFTFKVETPGTLVLYVRPENDRTYAVTSANGTKEYKSGDTQESCELSYDVASGDVTVAVVGSSTGYLIAIKFSYPNLP